MAKLLILGKEKAENIAYCAEKMGADLSLKGDASKIDQADVVYISAEFEKDKNLALINESYSARKTVIVGASPVPQGGFSPETLAKIDYLICNEEELSLICGFECIKVEQCERGARSLVQKGAKSVIVTTGKNGAVMAYPDGETSYPADFIQPVDTAGCGDCFNGSFAYMMAEGKNVNTAIEFAVNAATICAKKQGLRESFPFKEQVPMY